MFLGAAGPPLTEAVWQKAVPRANERARRSTTFPRRGVQRPMIHGRSEDKARRRIAYLLIALLALMIVALLAAVVFGVIPVSEIEGVRRDPRPARGAGIGGHRLLLRIQAVADSGAADRGFRIRDDLVHDEPETSLLRFTSPRGAAVEVDTAAPPRSPTTIHRR